MAFVNTYIIAGPQLELPTGHSQTTTVPSLTGVDFSEPKELTVACSGVVAATESAGIDALFTALDPAVDTIFTTDLGVNTTTHNVDYVFIVASVELETPGSIYLNDATRNYVVKGKLRAAITAV